MYPAADVSRAHFRPDRHCGRHPGSVESLLFFGGQRRDRRGHARLAGHSIRARTLAARGALYTALERLESKRYLRSQLGEPLAERGGRARRYFTVTATGLAALRAARRALLQLWGGLEGLLES